MRAAFISIAFALAGAVNAFQGLGHPNRRPTGSLIPFPPPRPSGFPPAPTTLATSTVSETSTSTGVAPPPGYTYVTGYPLCNVTGYTEVPGDYVETVYQQSNSTLTACFAACNAANSSICQSIAFNPRYNECIFYNAEVQDTQLYYDSTSTFDHYDLPCASLYTSAWIG